MRSTGEDPVIAWRVLKVGKKVTRFKPGDYAGVGCLVNSCGECEP